MSDTIDQMEERNERIDKARLENIMAKAQIVPGVPGDCDRCGEWSPRLVRSTCPPCRDKWKLP